MAPEIIQQDEDAIDGRADCYALAIVGYFLCTGRLPFDKAAVMDTLVAHLNEAPVPPSTYVGMPEDFEKVILSCLAKDPDERPANARALDQQLAACADAHRWTETQAADWWAQHPLIKHQTVIFQASNALP